MIAFALILGFLIGGCFGLGFGLLLVRRQRPTIEVQPSPIIRLHLPPASYDRPTVH